MYADIGDAGEGDGGCEGGLLTLNTDPTSPADRSVSHTISLSASPPLTQIGPTFPNLTSNV